MRVGVIQSNYIPWRGYFDFIDSVDLFVFHDDLQYTKNDWRNRNRIVTPEGLKWLTVPVRYASVSQKIDEVPIDYTQKWAERHLNQLREHYRRAPFYPAYIDGFAAIVRQNFASISELNVALCRWAADILDIHTPMRMSRDLGLCGTKSERLIDLLKKLGGSVYLSGPSAEAYLDLELFRECGIQVEYKSYDYPSYPQLHPPCGEASILDLIFNVGPDARTYLKSRTADRLVVEPVFHEQYF